MSYGLESQISLSECLQYRRRNELLLDHIATLKWNAEQDRGRSFQEATEILQNQYPEFSKEIALYYSQWSVMLKGAIEENVNILRNLHGRYQLYGLTNWSAESFPYAYQNYDFFSLLMEL